MSIVTLEDKILRFIRTFAPAETLQRQAFFYELRMLLEDYGRNAIAHGDLPDTEHGHNSDPHFADTPSTAEYIGRIRGEREKRDQACRHERLNEEGICRVCGADCRQG
jgi:hypothetical protein